MSEDSAYYSMASNVIGGLSEIQKVVVKELDGGAGGGICKVVVHKIPTHDMLCSLRSCFLPTCCVANLMHALQLFRSVLWSIQYISWWSHLV